MVAAEDLGAAVGEGGGPDGGPAAPRRCGGLDGLDRGRGLVGLDEGLGVRVLLADAPGDHDQADQQQEHDEQDRPAVVRLVGHPLSW